MNKRHKWADVIIAAAEGKTIQCCLLNSKEWRDYQGESVFQYLSFCADDYEYRVKPEIITKWKWAVGALDEGHMYEYISQNYYTEEEATQQFKGVVFYEKIIATAKEFEV